jgi:hypothetical protein
MRRVPIAVVLLAAISACASPSKPPAQPDSAFAARAKLIADGWRTALAGPAGDSWRTGFVPLQDLTVPPAEGFTDDLRFAFASGWYTSVVDLPADTPANGQVVLPDGTLSIPLVSASAGYHAIDQGDPPCRQPAGTPPASTPPAGTAPPATSNSAGPVGTTAPHTCAILTVTAAKLGTTTLRTSRGLASVPAWLFTMRELPAPVARAAFAAGSTTPVAYPTIPPAPADQLRNLAGAAKLTSAEDGRLQYTIGIGACDRNPTGLVYETDDAVVIGGKTDAPTESSCNASLRLQPVGVALAKPLGSRAIFDGVTGRPMIQSGSRF